MIFQNQYLNILLRHLLFHLLMDLHIRVGNEIYVPNSYGLTTLRQKHLKWVNKNQTQKNTEGEMDW